MILLLLLSIQTGIQPFLQQKFIAEDIHVPSIVAIQEVVKIVIGFSSLYASGQIHELKKWTLRESMQLVFIPASIYTAQNMLCQTAYIYADPLIYNLLNQTKTIWSALFVYILMGKRQSIQQMLALAVIFLCGARVSMLSATEKSSGDANHSFWWGVVPVLLAAVCSGLAGGLSQRALQKHNRLSLLYSIELSVYINSLVAFTTMLSLTSKGSSGASDGAFFRSWTPSTLIPIASNASGGLFVGLITKRVGAVQKGFSVVGSIIITAILRSLLQDEELAFEVWIALPLVVISIVAYNLYPAKPKVLAKNKGD